MPPVSRNSLLLCAVMSLALLAAVLAPAPTSAASFATTHESAAVERAKSRAKLTVSPKRPLQGTKAVFKTKLKSKPKVRRPVVLERKVGSTWRKAAKGRTKRSGKVKLKAVATANATWRVRAKKTKAGGKRLPSITSKTRKVNPIPRAALASATLGGGPGNGNSTEPDLSGDGRYMVFSSQAQNLVSGFTGYPDTAYQVYLRDRVAGTTLLISVAEDGLTPGNASSTRPVISRDGRFVAFQSRAGDLVDGDDNNRLDIFRWDREDGTLIMVSRDGADTDEDSADPTISGDGQLIAFASEATNLDADDENDARDVYLWDADTGDVDRVSEGVLSQEGNDDSGSPHLSADGRYLSYSSRASNLVFNDSNGGWDIFRRDLEGTGLAMVSRGADTFASDDDSEGPSAMSADGRYVGFASAADNLVPGGTVDNDFNHTFVRDMVAGTTVLVSRVSLGPPPLIGSAPGSVSDDGRYVIYRATRFSLMIDETVGSGAFVWDRNTGKSTQVIRDKAWGPLDERANGPVLSANGRWIAFSTRADDAHPRDRNGKPDVYFWRQR